ncbi:MAG: ABC transporter ATP-binding protein [Lachnospiraceae bacterium]|nr:ABC transporter ATP-binding protein [Lachnospiraceae bacterium]
MSIIVEARDLTKHYGSDIAVDHLDLTLEKGQIIGLLGPNGSGKTTFIKMINGLLTPTSGMILINGEKPGVNSKKVISYLPERCALPDWMRINDLVKMYCDFFADFNKDKARTMLADLHLDEKKNYKTLSKGNREKVQLILCMAREAELYCLDEPIGGVDPAARDYILRTILQNYNEEAAVLISTHLIQDVESTLDRALFLKEGTLVLNDTVDNIREQRGKSVDALFREVFAC